MGQPKAKNIFARGLQSLLKVKLRGGVVGKVAVTLITLVLGATAVCMKLNTDWMILSLFLSIAVIVSTFLWRIINFAKEHPVEALFEGAELLAYEELKQAVKGEGITKPLDRVPSVVYLQTRR